jgi:hypothetical protein
VINQDTLDVEINVSLMLWWRLLALNGFEKIGRLKGRDTSTSSVFKTTKTANVEAQIPYIWPRGYIYRRCCCYSVNWLRGEVGQLELRFLLLPTM